MFHHLNFSDGDVGQSGEKQIIQNVCVLVRRSSPLAHSNKKKT